MGIELRCEQPGDEEAVDIVNCRAFHSMDGANIVRLLRQYHPAFDRRYSVTAWDGARMVGHSLFTPADLRLMGRTVRALAVGPVAVVPQYQRQRHRRADAAVRPRDGAARTASRSRSFTATRPTTRATAIAPATGSPREPGH